MNYAQLKGGGIGHSHSRNSNDPTKARENHGDRVIADAVAWKVIQEVRRRDPGEQRIPAGSLMARRLQYESATAQQGTGTWG